MYCSFWTLPSLSLEAELSKIRTNLQTHCLHSEPPVVWPSVSTEKAPTAGAIKGVLAAMHTEMQQQRQRNAVINGLNPVDGVANVNLFTELCKTCLPVEPRIVVIAADDWASNKQGNSVHFWLLWGAMTMQWNCCRV